ncbi:hypothetical protein P4O66_010107 [Electrophorus voltai]|uniref:Retrotransposon gag domain-containing protein n=1 Tax=Electrophorus voltai TaxID=2609070 RepID=A0AAD8Z9J7_9TELE|nr:hypothetical protein P4O66_010107 [Electrophorus voltai]
MLLPKITLLRLNISMESCSPPNTSQTPDENISSSFRVAVGDKRAPLQKDLAIDPAQHLDLEQVKVTLTNQGVTIGRHGQALQQIISQLQGLMDLLAWISYDAIQMPMPSAAPNQEAASAAAAAEPFQIRPILHSEPLLPTPERYASEAGGCRGILLQCSLAFEQQPSRFPIEQAKVAYIISLLTGWALVWATPVWEYQTDICSTWAELAAAHKRTFDHPVAGGEMVSRFLNIRQGKRSVTDYTIEFRTMAAKSRWYPTALMAAFHDLVLRIDNHIQERHRARAPEVI